MSYRNHLIAILFVGCLVAPLSTRSLRADDELTAEQIRFFESKIRPVLVRECYSCHSTKVGAIKGGLWLDTKEGMLSGGDSGPAIVPRKLSESLLWGAINHEDYNMPPRKKLSDEILADFKTWIEMGAPDPRVTSTTKVRSSISEADIAKGRKFWSFVPPVAPTVPDSVSDWPRSDIDRFIWEGLQARELTPNEDADPNTLLRRISFDLTGLPPTAEQTRWFESRWEDGNTQSREVLLEKLVDTLLDSQQYGEKWARHWLDVARYAESTGKELNLPFTHAWRYRDYVIDAFNADKPYNEFVQQQIAGDLMPAKTDEEWTDGLIATGFLALGPKTLTEQNGRQFELDLIDEQIDVTTRVMLGVSVACARCHDHKFDPIPQTDYYALAGIFKSTTTHYGTTDSLQNRRPSNLLALPVYLPGPNQDKLSKQALQQLKDRLKQREADLREALAERRRKRQGMDNDNPRQTILTVARISNEIGTLEARINSVDENGDPQSYCMGVQSADRPVDAQLLERGEFDKPRQTVKRGFPQVLCSTQPDIQSNSSGRLEFARWVGSEENPLTARVMVNRVWSHLMGHGLVRTPENFGATGLPATNQDLLDHLAVEFMDSGWSLKKMVKMIVLSRAYRMSSRFDPEKFAADPENKLGWRFEPKRLSAESLRDAMLAISGQLDKQRPLGSVVAKAGPAIIRDGNLFSLSGTGESLQEQAQKIRKQSFRERRESISEIRKQIKPIDQPTRVRSVYLPIVRDNLPRSLDVFDFAEPTMVVGARSQSNTPDQGLYFLNNEFVMEQCDALAADLIAEHDKVKERIKRAFLLAYGRDATSAELRAANSFYQKFQPTGVGRGAVEQRKLSALCQAIVASAEFRFLN